MIRSYIISCPSIYLDLSNHLDIHLRNDLPIYQSTSIRLPIYPSISTVAMVAMVGYELSPRNISTDIYVEYMNGGQNY